MSYEVKARYILDPIQMASVIEVVFNKYLKPVICEDGIYINHSKEPVLKAGNLYYCKQYDRKTNSTIEIPIQSINDINGPVFNINDEIVLSEVDKKRLSTKPTLPIRGIKIIEAYIDNIVNEESAWSDCLPRTTMELLNEFLLPQYRNNNKVAELLDFNLLDFAIPIREFIGPDKWIMHFQSNECNDIVIEKTIDYRIAAWMREHADELSVNKYRCV